MFPKWDNDKTNVALKNMVNFMFSAKAHWKWTQDCWSDKGTNPWTNPKVIFVTDGFWQCVKEMKLLADKMKSLEKKV